MAKARTPRAIWEKRVERLRDSELTDAEFAAEVGVNVHTLRSWKWKLRTEQQGQRGAKPSRAKRTKRGSKRAKEATRRGATTFIEVMGPGTGVELVVRGVEVRVPVGFDETTLSRVVTVLRAAS